MRRRRRLKNLKRPVKTGRAHVRSGPPFHKSHVEQSDRLKWPPVSRFPRAARADGKALAGDVNLFQHVDGANGTGTQAQLATQPLNNVIDDPCGTDVLVPDR